MEICQNCNSFLTIVNHPTFDGYKLIVDKVCGNCGTVKRIMEPEQEVEYTQLELDLFEDEEPTKIPKYDELPMALIKGDGTYTYIDEAGEENIIETKDGDLVHVLAIAWTNPKGSNRLAGDVYVVYHPQCQGTIIIHEKFLEKLW